MSDDDEYDNACKTIGKMIVAASLIDRQLNNILILALHLGESESLKPILGSIDTTRKIDILKIFCKKIAVKDWKKIITKYCDSAEDVIKKRNIVAHSYVHISNNKVVLLPSNMAHTLRAINLTDGIIAHVELSTIQDAIANGAKVLTLGDNVLYNLRRMADEFAIRQASRTSSDPSKRT